jgi:hypothetical protein
MSTGQIVGFIVLLLVSMIAFMISIMQFKEKGVLFNNAFLYASKRERETMDKKPHYRQSAIVFCILGFIFLLNAIQILTYCKELFWGIMLLIMVVIVYAIASSISIDKKKKKK